MDMHKITTTRTFTVERPGNEYADLIALTAKLIGRSFPATFKMVEHWEPGFLAALDADCLSKWKNRGFKSPAHMWFTERKRLLAKTTRRRPDDHSAARP